MNVANLAHVKMAGATTHKVATDVNVTQAIIQVKMAKAVMVGYALCIYKINKLLAKHLALYYNNVRVWLSSCCFNTSEC